MGHTEVLEKMSRLINTTPVEQKKVAERWVSLANRWLQKEFADTGDWGILGGSMALETRFRKKFGSFCPRSEAITEQAL